MGRIKKTATLLYERKRSQIRASRNWGIADASSRQSESQERDKAVFSTFKGRPGFVSRARRKTGSRGNKSRQVGKTLYRGDFRASIDRWQAETKSQHRKGKRKKKRGFRAISAEEIWRGTREMGKDRRNALMRNVQVGAQLAGKGKGKKQNWGVTCRT